VCVCVCVCSVVWSGTLFMTLFLPIFHTSLDMVTLQAIPENPLPIIN